MAFAASLRSPRTFQLGYMRGHRAGTVDGLVTEVGQGLGGEALAVGGPLGVADYTRAPGITHQFDQAVAAEGLHAVFAVPVRLESELRGAVYGAVRRPLVLGDRFWRMVVEAVRAAARVPLFLSVETVKSYLKSAMAKLDSHTRCEAVQRARRADLLP